VMINPDGTVTYSPPPTDPLEDFTTPGSFTYKAIDGGGLKSGATTVTINPILCSEDEVTDVDGDVTGTYTRLTDPFACKQFTLTASSEDDTILFQPSGASEVVYRGVLSFGADVNPPPGADSLRLRYDPTGGFTFQAMKWCLSPQFDETNILETADGFPLFAAVTSATVPPNESWCIASAYTQSDSNGDKVVFWQVYGIDDPRSTR
jgi:hypothetical protein